jgi:hypothetical protein
VTVRCSILNLSPFQISGRDFVLGGRAVTPHISNPHDYVNHMFKETQSVDEFPNLEANSKFSKL